MFLRHFHRISKLTCVESNQIARIQQFHLSAAKCDTPENKNLNQFFEDPKNLKENVIRVGRQWKKDELRLKSNEDLHKLWFVLLKERNMLMTMEQAYKEAVEKFPNPERLDKVEESMENLESVVRERNRAYFELETGESGERERIIRSGPFGLDEGYVKQEHFLPRKYNIEYRKMLRHRYYTSWNRHVKEFHGRFLEMRRKEELQERLKQMRHVSWILKRFPDTDEKAIKEKYPLADVNAVKRWYKVKGHHNNDRYDV